MLPRHTSTPPWPCSACNSVCRIGGHYCLFLLFLALLSWRHATLTFFPRSAAQNTPAQRSRTPSLRISLLSPFTSRACGWRRFLGLLHPLCHPGRDLKRAKKGGAFFAQHFFALFYTLQCTPTQVIQNASINRCSVNAGLLCISGQSRAKQSARDLSRRECH